MAYATFIWNSYMQILLSQMCWNIMKTQPAIVIVVGTWEINDIYEL